MAFELTDNARRAIQQINVRPQLLFKIEGLDTVFASAGIYKYIRIGDPGLLIGDLNGDPWYIGGFSLIEGQAAYLSLDKGGVATINQSLDPSRGQGTTVPRMVVPLLDKNGEVSNLISPGFQLDDVIGKNCEVLLGFVNTAYPEDYIRITVGQIEGVESSPGLINMIISAPEERKRQTIYPQAKTKLTSSINNSQTTIMVDDPSLFINKVLGPDSTYDSIISFYAKIEDEVVQVTNVSGSVLTVVRAQYGTTAAAHDAEKEIESFVRFTENGIKLALKLMLSGFQGPYGTYSATKFNFASGISTIPGAIYFPNNKLNRDENVQIGDYVTITGATNGGNNLSAKRITGVFDDNNGSYITVAETLVDETGSSASVAIRSQYDTLPQGLKMLPKELDIERFEYLYQTFLSSFMYDFIVEEVGLARDFIETEIFVPMAAFSVPRQGRSSVGYHIGPIPGTILETIDSSNTTNASKLTLKRGISEAFFNQVLFKWGSDPKTDKLSVSKPFDSATSQTQLRRTKTRTIESKGLNDAFQGLSLASQAAERLLKRYAFAAEYIKGIEVQPKIGVPIEIGDIVVLDFQSLQITDTTQGTRGGTQRLMEVQNKVQDNKTGKVKLDLVNTSFQLEDRYGLISPSSYLKAAISVSQIVLTQSFGYTGIEGDKWSEFIGAAVIVRSVDSTSIQSSFIDNVNGDIITLDPPLSSLPSAGQIMELDTYDKQTDKVKLFFAFMSDDDNDFADGQPPYVQL